MRHALRRTVAAILITLTITAGLTATRTPQASAADNPRDELWAYVVSQRFWYGVGGFNRSWWTDPTLDAFAQAHAQRMANANDLHHSGALGNLRLVGWGGTLGENVAVAPTLFGAHRALSYSPSHLRNQLGEWDAMGLGIAHANGRVWVVEVFGNLN